MTTRRRRSPREHAGLARRAAGVVASVAIASIATALLAGCASEPEDEPVTEALHVARWAGRSDRTPSVGECWQEPDYEVVSTWSWWQGSAPVDCAAEHNSITAVMGELPDDFPAPWTEAGERRELADEELGLLNRTCADGTGMEIGLRDGWRATWFWYLPSPREWAAGERWLRCDVAVIALGPLSPMVVESLPADVEAVKGRLLDEYGLCLDTPYPAEGHGPWDDPDGNVAVSCDGAYQWTHVMSLLNPDEELPPQEVLIERIEGQCQELIDLNQASGATVYFPSEETWAEGVRTSTCWIHY